MMTRPTARALITAQVFYWMERRLHCRLNRCWCLL
jgi:hypothetical protein